MPERCDCLLQARCKKQCLHHHIDLLANWYYWHRIHYQDHCILLWHYLPESEYWEQTLQYC
jgi:hypothetical protein